MAKEYAKPFYNSKAWEKCRESYIVKVFELCEHCGDAGYIVDHIEEITPNNINDPNITLNHDNLQYLCTPCHNRKTFGSKKEYIREGLKFNSMGELVRDDE